MEKTESNMSHLIITILTVTVFYAILVGLGSYFYNPPFIDGHQVPITSAIIIFMGLIALLIIPHIESFIVFHHGIGNQWSAGAGAIVYLPAAHAFVSWILPFI